MSPPPFLFLVSSASDFPAVCHGCNLPGCLFAIRAAMPFEAMVNKQWGGAPTVVCLRLRRWSPREMGFNQRPSAGDEVVSFTSARSDQVRTIVMFKLP